MKKPQTIRAIALRDAVLTSLAVFIVALLTSFVVYYSAAHGMKLEVQAYLGSMARTAAQMVDGDAHKDIIHPEQKYSRPYEKLRAPFFDILTANPNISFIYTIIEKDEKLFFVLDSQIVGPDEEDETSGVMEEYEEQPEAMLRAIKKQMPAVDDEPETDEWGTWLSGYAPFYDRAGNFVGIVGLDMSINDYMEHLAEVRKALLIGFAIASVFSVVIGFLIWTVRHHALTSAEAANKAKSEFLANMSHELRTPMHGILASAEMVEEYVKEGETELISKRLKIIQQSGQRLLRLLNDLLDLSKLEAGKMQFNMRPANICEVVERAANSFQELMKGRNIHLQQECDTALREQTITMDADRIEQVIANLISNAIKFSPDNGVIRIRVQRHSEGPQPMLAFEISDEGPGVPAGEEEKIFDKFIQSSRTKTGAGGTGLGLSICRQIIEAHRGKIWYTHPAGELGRFCFSLPILTDS